MKVFKNIINKHIGVFTVIKCVEKHELERESLYECVCDYCKNAIILKRKNINRIKSCGCNGYRNNFYKNKTYGELTINNTFYKNGKLYAHCTCSCGNTCEANVARMKIGKVRSCGHLIGHNNSKHNMTNTRFYRIWVGLKTRCNPKSVKSKNYGKRGITYCDRWEEFENFKKDMYNSYLEHIKKYGEKNTTIDRIDVNGNYEPSNCRWATYKEQANNTRQNHNITYNGETHTLHEWGNILGLSYDILRGRIEKLHWNIDRAFNTPKMERGKKLHE